MTIEFENGKPVGYSTIHEIAKKWGIAYVTAMQIVNHYKLPTVKLGNTNYIREDTEKPIGKRGPKKKDAE